MLKELFSNRLFIGALAFFILSVVGGMLYISHVEKQSVEELATDEDRVKQLTEKQQPQPTAKAPVGDTSQGGHFHEDETWHEGAHVPVPSASHVASDTGLQSPQMSVPQQHRDTTGDVPIPTDIYDKNAWADYYAKAIPGIPLNRDDEAAWTDYFDRVTVVKKPVDPTNTDDYRAYIDPLHKEAFRIMAEREKLQKQLSALPIEVLPPTVKERAHFFDDINTPYFFAISRLNNEGIRRSNEWHRRVDAYLEHGRR